MSKIVKQLCLIMGEINPIAKGQKNQMQGYSFRGIDDVYNELNSLMAKHGVVALPEVLEDRTEERQTTKGGTLIYRVLKIKYHFYADDGTTLTATVIGEGMDSGDKASNKAMSAAQKYAFIQVFVIPTAEPKDSEHQSHEVKPKPVELYTAKDDAQKRAFANVAIGCGMDKNDDIALREVSAYCLNTPVTDLVKKIKEYISNPIGAGE